MRVEDNELGAGRNEVVALVRAHELHEHQLLVVACNQAHHDVMNFTTPAPRYRLQPSTLWRHELHEHQLFVIACNQAHVLYDVNNADIMK